MSAVNRLMMCFGEASNACRTEKNIDMLRRGEIFRLYSGVLGTEPSSGCVYVLVFSPPIFTTEVPKHIIIIKIIIIIIIIHTYNNNIIIIIIILNKSDNSTDCLSKVAPSGSLQSIVVVARFVFK